MSIKSKQKAIQGFTLVELSIVIVIIGFLVAGIAAGANMVKQAQIRSVISDLQSYQTSFNNFKAKYNKIPGDMDTATSFWPADGQCVADVATEADVCDGDNNGLINFPIGGIIVDETDETVPALKHLALANMISAGIPVVPATPVAMVPGVNTPTSKISGAGYFLTREAAPGLFPAANYIVLGKPTTTADSLLLKSALKSEDAFSIDQKTDDGTVNGTTFSGAMTGNFFAATSSNAFDPNVTTPEDCADINTGEYTIATEYESCGVFQKLD